MKKISKFVFLSIAAVTALGLVSCGDPSDKAEAAITVSPASLTASGATKDVTEENVSVVLKGVKTDASSCVGIIKSSLPELQKKQTQNAVLDAARAVTYEQLGVELQALSEKISEAVAAYNENGTAVIEFGSDELNGDVQDLPNGLFLTINNSKFRAEVKEYDASINSGLNVEAGVRFDQLLTAEDGTVLYEPCIKQVSVKSSLIGSARLICTDPAKETLALSGNITFGTGFGISYCDKTGTGGKLVGKVFVGFNGSIDDIEAWAEDLADRIDEGNITEEYVASFPFTVKLELAFYNDSNEKTCVVADVNNIADFVTYIEERNVTVPGLSMKKSAAYSASSQFTVVDLANELYNMYVNGSQGNAVTPSANAPAIFQIFDSVWNAHVKYSSFLDWLF